jgi:hypothetical protein
MGTIIETPNSSRIRQNTAEKETKLAPGIQRATRGRERMTSRPKPETNQAEPMTIKAVAKRP